MRKLFATVPFDSRDDRYYFFLIVGMKICGIDLKRIFVARFVIYLHYIGLATKQLRIFFLENQRQFFHGITLFCNVLPILINHLLPSFRQHHNPTFVKLVVFINKKLNQVRFNIIIVIEIFTIQGVL